MDGGFTNAGDERVGIDDIRVIGDATLVDGDCNGDGLLDPVDLNCTTSSTIAGMLQALNLLAGDLNADGDVGFNDFLSLSANFGTADSGYPSGDIDVNGDVSFADFLAMSANFGKSSGAAAVPEPNSLILLLGSLAPFARRRRRAICIGVKPAPRRSLSLPVAPVIRV